MSSKEEHSLAFCKVLKRRSMPKDEIVNLPKQHRILRGTISNWEGEERRRIEADGEQSTEGLGTDGDSHDKGSDIEELSSKLVVSDLPSTAHEDLIRFYFENRKNFGGLEVLDVEYDEENAVAIVEFENASDIDIVLEKVPIKLIGQVVNVARYEPEREEPVDPRVVQVSGPEDIVKDIETLELYFENKRRSGGGDINNLKYDEDLNVLPITFEEEDVAQRVIKRGNHFVKKQSIEVVQFVPSKTTAFPTVNKGKEDAVKDTVKVSGVVPNIRSTTELYFGNTKRSGGGDYEEIWSDEEEEAVIYIKFKSEEVAQRVLLRDDHEVQGRQLFVELYIPVKVKLVATEQDTEPVYDEEPDQDTVKVCNVSPSMQCTVELYFENTRQSGGGEICDVWNAEEEEGVIFIRFKSEKVAKRVTSRQHSVEDQELIVAIHIPPKSLPSYEDKVLIKGLSQSTSKDGLFNFIEAKSGLVPETLDYHESEQDIAMVTFESKADIRKLEEIFRKFKLEGNTLKVMPVPVSNCIMVADLPENITKDTVQFYFENHRKSGGGEVQNVIMNDDDSCLVYFVDYKVIDDVLNQYHILSNKMVFIQRFQDCLGKSEGDIMDRKLEIPAPIVLKHLDKYKVKFANQSAVYKHKLEEKLKTFHSKVCWPKEFSDSLMIKCTMTQAVDGCFRLVKTWTSDILENIKSYMDDMSVQNTEILPDAWQNVIQKLKEVKYTNPENIALYIDKKVSTVYIVGAKEDVSALKVQLDSIVADVLNV